MLNLKSSILTTERTENAAERVAQGFPRPVRDGAICNPAAPTVRPPRRVILRGFHFFLCRRFCADTFQKDKTKGP